MLLINRLLDVFVTQKNFHIKKKSNKFTNP